MKTFIENAKLQLLSIYPENESMAIIQQLIRHVTGFSKAQLLLHKNSELSAENSEELNAKLLRLKNGEPIQYVTGEAEFYGLTFRVNPSVLIPRPETEELVDLILKENHVEGLSILDIGTGSGCIPVTLCKNLCNPLIEAWDVSEEALETARLNAELNNQPILFRRVDVLDQVMTTRKFDIIVSNPPYVCDSESESMHPNVLDFEPHLALFVPDADPLLFYRRIAELATSFLTKGGKLYFEINAAFGQQTADLLKENRFSEIEIVKDIFGKERFVKGVYNWT